MEEIVSDLLRTVNRALTVAFTWNADLIELAISADDQFDHWTRLQQHAPSRLIKDKSRPKALAKALPISQCQRIGRPWHRTFEQKSFALQRTLRLRECFREVGR